MQGKDSSKKNKAVSRILWIGFMVLILCVGVCVVLAIYLQSTFRKQFSDDYYVRHATAAEYLNRMLDRRAAQSKKIAEIVSAAGDEQDLTQRLDRTIGFSEMETVFFVNREYGLYRNAEPAEGLNFEMLLGLLEELNYNENDIYIGHAPAVIRLNAGASVIIATPVRNDGEMTGFVFVPLRLADILDSEVFRYQNQIGDCLIVDKVGEIIATSSAPEVVSHTEETFQLGLLAHSDGGDRSRKAVQELNYNLNKKGSGYINIISEEGYGVQVSYSFLNGTEQLFLVSCCKDNLVDGRLQPLLFGSVLACIFIIVLMLTSLTVVWATAKRTNMTVERLAYEDPVTGGKNLNYFREFALNQMISARETPFVIYRFDIANFRYINESYGHQRADKVLVSCIKSFREVFSEKELCVRMDADQFLALLVNDSLLDKRFDEFTNAVNADARGNNIKFPVRFKCGICQIKKHDHDIDVMIDHANVARKTIGPDNKEMRAFYSESLVDDMRKVSHIENIQQKAMAENEFRVYLQPKWDIKENHITGAEALVRWIRSDGTILKPEQFIPIFENNGFIEQLDFYTLESVCMRMKEMIEEGVEPLPVSVNQSGLLLHSPDYVENVEKLLHTYNVPSGAIELEITEKVFANDREAMIGIIHRLKLLGVRLAMDDFGVGYSSLTLLSDVPFDVIKIDGAFFASSEGNERERMILTSVVKMVKDLGMEIVCEGVESESQVEFLQRIGCNKVQGYYFSRPISEPDFIRRYYKNEKEG
ncbi:MAG: GGDEF domain-containing protein [Lachnospiraceae bacterium]|nr:GGDEF domain-containing protein [Lachnospiraceae bacterium]